MPPKPLPTDIKAGPPPRRRGKFSGRFRVINPRGIPKGRYIIRSGKRRYFEGNEYDGDSVEHWLERGFIEPMDGGVTEVSRDEEVSGDD